MERMIAKQAAATLLLLLFPGGAMPAWSGPKSVFDGGRKSAEWLQAYQVWGAASPEFREANPAPRADLFLRRARLGVRGQAHPGLDYTAWFASDNLGRDPQAGSSGPGFQVWDAYFTWHLDSAWAGLSFGLLLPQVSDELVRSPFTLPSLDVAATHVPARDHLGLKPSGRATGIRIGGSGPSQGWTLGYDAGIYDAASDGASQGAASPPWSPLLTARVSAARSGIRLSAFGAGQGGTGRRGLYGGGLMLQRGGLELDAEIDVLATRLMARPESGRHVWHARALYRMPLHGGSFLEPVLAYGALGADAQTDAGLNWIIRPDGPKISLHHVARNNRKGMPARSDFLVLALQVAI